MIYISNDDLPPSGLSYEVSDILYIVYIYKETKRAIILLDEPKVTFIIGQIASYK